MYSYLQNVKTNVRSAKRKRPKVIKSLKSKWFFIGITSIPIEWRPIHPATRLFHFYILTHIFLYHNNHLITFPTISHKINYRYEKEYIICCSGRSAWKRNWRSRAHGYGRCLCVRWTHSHSSPPGIPGRIPAWPQTPFQGAHPLFEGDHEMVSLPPWLFAILLLCIQHGLVHFFRCAPRIPPDPLSAFGLILLHDVSNAILQMPRWFPASGLLHMHQLCKCHQLLRSTKKGTGSFPMPFSYNLLLAFLSFLPFPAVLSRARRTYTAALASRCDQGVIYNILIFFVNTNFSKKKPQHIKCYMALCFTGI